MSNETAATLGTTLDETARRDAVHIALYPAIAGCRLKPGQRVGLLDGKFVPATAPHAIGIIDPFLPRNVREGQRCWAMLNPGQVTGLRHVYTHPGVPD